MADENFVLTLVGRLDEKETKKNVQTALNNISGSVNVNGSGKSGITVFDKADLEAQGRKYLESANNIKDQLIKMFDPTGTKNLDIKIDEIFDNQGLAKFKARIAEAGEAVKTLNFDRAKFTDNTEGFILKSSVERDIQEINAVDARLQAMGQTLNRVVDGWGSLKSTYDTRQDFLADYQQSVLSKTGNPTVNYTINKNNEITGFTAEIKDANDQLQKLHYNLVKIRDDDGNVIQEFFSYAGGSVRANGFEQTTQQIEKQRVALSQYANELKKIEGKDLNPENHRFIGESDKLQEVTDKFRELQKSIEQMQEQNKNGSVIPTKDIDDYIIKYRELKTEIDLLRSQTNKGLDHDESAVTLARNIDIARSKIDLLIERWKQAGIYTGDFQTKAEALKASLDTVGNSKGIDEFNDKLRVLTNNAQQLQTQLRTTARDESFTQRLRILQQQVEAFANANTKAAQTYTVQFQLLRDGIANATNVNDLRRLQNEFRSLKIAVQDAGLAGKTFGERMKETFGRVLRFTGITSLFMTLSRGFRQLLENVKDLDTAMVNLRKVTDESEATYSDVFKNATESAKELHTEITNIIEATAEYAKLGYNINEAQELAKASVVYQNVGEISSAEEASQSIISTMKAFGIEAENVMEIVDKFNLVGNNFSISAEGVGSALQRSASSLATANNTLSESIALIVAANNVLQNPETVGF